MRLKGLSAIHAVCSISIGMLIGSALAFGQTPHPQTPNSGFSVAPLKDEVVGNAAAQNTPKSQSGSPDRTVGPQQDGSIVASDNQTLTPAGRIIELGSPVRAKAIALNPN